jgi:hypothetical protein
MIMIVGVAECKQLENEPNESGGNAEREAGPVESRRSQYRRSSDLSGKGK